MKRFALIIFVILVSCLFALSVSAEERSSISYTDADGVTHNVPMVRFDDDTPEVVAAALGNNVAMQTLFKDDNAYVILCATDGSLCAYPTWYIIEPSGSSASYVAISEVEYGYINSNNPEGKTYERGAVRYIEFTEGMTHLRNNGVFGRGNHYENNVTEIVIPSTVTEVQDMAFSTARSLRAVHIPDNNSIKRIGDDAFIHCENLEVFDFSKLTFLEFIDGFNNCAKLPDVLDLSNSTSLTEIGNNCFNGCYFTRAYLPDSVKRIGNGVFNNNALTYFDFPVSLEYIGDDALSGNTDMVIENGILPKNLSYVGVNFLNGCKHLPETIVFPEGVTTIPDEGFPNVSRPNGEGNLNIVFLGKMTKVIIDGSPYQNWAEHVTVYFAQNTISDFNGKVYSYTDKESGELGEYVTQSGTLVLDVSDRSVSSTSKVGDNFIQLIFCGGTTVEQTYVLTTNGESITEDRGMFDIENHAHMAYSVAYGDCTSPTVCIICEVDFAEAEHNYILTIDYSKGFLASGVKSQSCQNPECTVSMDNVDISPIFVSLGISMSTFEGSVISVVQGYAINRDAYTEYVSNVGTLNMGLVIAAKRIAGDEPVVVNGSSFDTTSEKAILITDGLLANDYLEIKVVGISAANSGEELVMCMFAYDGEKVVYFHNGSESTKAGAVVIDVQ